MDIFKEIITLKHKVCIWWKIKWKHCFFMWVKQKVWVSIRLRYELASDSYYQFRLVLILISVQNWKHILPCTVKIEIFHTQETECESRFLCSRLRSTGHFHEHVWYAPTVPDFLLLSAVTLANNQVAGKKFQFFCSVYLYPNVNISVFDACRSLRCPRTAKSTKQVCLLSARKHLFFSLDWKHTGGHLVRA